MLGADPRRAEGARSSTPWLGVSALLHAGGTPGTWGNLGLWAEGSAGDYAQAATALADAVGQAAALRPGDAVASLACGAGEELLRWRQHFGAGELLGLERDTALLAAAQARVAAQGLQGITLARCAGAEEALQALRSRPGRFDVVAVVDAAYHLGPRRRLIDAAAIALKPGGRLVFTDLVLPPPARSGSAPQTRAQALPRWLARQLLRGAVRLCDMSLPEAPQPHGAAPPASLPTPHAASTEPLPSMLRASGFTVVQAQRLDEPVLGGFTRFVAAQRLRLGHQARGAAWRRIALTAALIAPARRAGLGYALVAACRA